MTYSIMKEKQKTCITIIEQSGLLPLAKFTDVINITHNVHKIRVASIGGIITNVGYVPPYDDDIYYITSDLISNTHDNILGSFNNITGTNSKNKEFRPTSISINGEYEFTIYQSNNEIGVFPGKIFIDLEFIELEND